MHNNTLTTIFNDFAQCLNQTKIECESSSYTMDPFTKARIILGRLYYACFHKGLEDFEILRNSRSGNKHKKLKEKLLDSSREDHQKLYELLLKLYDLRVWADYEYTNDIYQNATPANIGYYIFQINQLLTLPTEN